MSEKICPILSMAAQDTLFTECQRASCCWWVTGYTTERLPISCCAMEFLALKNSEGKYRV